MEMKRERKLDREREKEREREKGGVGAKVGQNHATRLHSAADARYYLLQRERERERERKRERERERERESCLWRRDTRSQLSQSTQLHARMYQSLNCRRKLLNTFARYPCLHTKDFNNWTWEIGIGLYKIIFVTCITSFCRHLFPPLLFPLPPSRVTLFLVDVSSRGGNVRGGGIVGAS
jgi:hypothetical protein